MTLPETRKKYKTFVYDASDNNSNSGWLQTISIALPTHSERPGIDDPADRHRIMLGSTGDIKQIP